MIKTLVNAFKVKDIRKRLIYTLFILVVVRLGSQIVIPGSNPDALKDMFSSFDSSGFFDAFTGGSFSAWSIFALSITPYITASIIMQLLTIAIPKLEELHKDGEDGRKKIAEITRYLTVGLALIESLAMAIGFSRTQVTAGANLIDNSPQAIMIVVAAMTAGSALLMWLGENITEHGIGNGISVVLMINIISRVPNDIAALYTQFVKGATNMINAIGAVIVILAVIGFVIGFVVLLSDAERRIPVQYAKKVQGRKQVGGQSTYIPLKVNTAGVIPVIFTTSLLQLPIIISKMFGIEAASGVDASGKHATIWEMILKLITTKYWFNFESLSEFKYTFGLVIYVTLLIFFAYFYTSITFNPIEVANNMKKQGGFVPGIRPGKPTQDYLTSVLNSVIFIGATGLAFVSIIPLFFEGSFNVSMSFGGTSMIIIVGVILETMKQIEAQMLVRHYKGFLND